MRVMNHELERLFIKTANLNALKIGYEMKALNLMTVNNTNTKVRLFSSI